VYCEPKSRIRIFECVGRSEVFTLTDVFVARYAPPLDRRVPGPLAQAFPGR
jgi:hypothetical protein